MGTGAKLLVVDDDHMMLDFALRVLASLNYPAVAATEAVIALRMLQQDPEICGLFVDLRLGKAPDGAQLAQQALLIRPDLWVILTSGDPGSLQCAGRDLQHNVELLPKPYRRHELADRLSRLM
ncbi:hypothetical protein ACROSR_15285 [Roseovarius tibetensis]|uniref:hypothetical protein n=1 Tax=Roseovarius tibetensis TaxID=2685897 RepID=UPI003D7F4BBF